MRLLTRAIGSVCAAAGLAAAAGACGEPAPGPNTARAGFVALTADEAWARVVHDIDEARHYQRCDEAAAPCAERSAYLRERPGTYWFVLHEVAPACDTPVACAPDHYRYLEVDELGVLGDHGEAVVLYRLDGAPVVLEGAVIWGIPDLSGPRPRRLEP